MKYRLLACVVSLLLLINSMSVTAYATSGGGYSRGDFSGYSSWSRGDKIKLWLDSAWCALTDVCGIIISPSRWTKEEMQDCVFSYYYDREIAKDYDSFEEYVVSHMYVDEDAGTVTLDDELMDALKVTVDTWIDEETGWYNIQTASVSDVSALWFNTSSEYYRLKGFLENLDSDEAIIIRSIVQYHDGTTDHGKGALCSDILNLSDYNLVLDRYYEISESYPYGGVSFCFYEEWIKSSKPRSNMYYILSETELIDNPTSATWGDSWYSISMDACTFPSVEIRNSQTSTQFVGGDIPYSRVLFTKSPKILRVYKTLDDLKQYSVGERPYYITDSYNTYDSSQDNTATLTESDLENSSVYGDVYNYITNNYGDDADSLTEDELIKILDKYFDSLEDKIDNSGNGSGESGDSSGGGLGGFLEGLGSLGDALLGIIGKLIEYIGKAVDLIVNGISGIIDKIPKSITALMSAAFPFLPEEFFTAIELALILGVVCIVIKIFK